MCQVLSILSYLVFTNDKVIFIFTDKKTNPYRIQIIFAQDHIAGKVVSDHPPI